MPRSFPPAPTAGRARLRVPAALLVIGVLVLVGQPVLVSAQVAGVPRPSGAAYFGAWVKPEGSESRQQAILRAEQQINRTYAVDHGYYKWNSPIPTNYDAWTAAAGRIPFLNWSATRTDGSVASWARIASGAEDSWIASRADAFRSFGHPVYLSFEAEPENDVPSSGSPTDYVAATRRIVDVFRARGVSNVTFVWVMMAWSYDQGAAEALKFYPGDGYVDVVGADGYNWYPSRPTAPWRPFSEVMAATRAFAIAHGKPFMAAEYGVQEDPAQPGRKAQWFRDLLVTARAWPELIAVVYFDSNRDAPWTVGTSASSLAAYREIGADPYLRPGTVVPPPSPSPARALTEPEPRRAQPLTQPLAESLPEPSEPEPEPHAGGRVGQHPRRGSAGRSRVGHHVGRSERNRLQRGVGDERRVADLRRRGRSVGSRPGTSSPPVTTRTTAGTSLPPRPRGTDASTSGSARLPPPRRGSSGGSVPAGCVSRSTSSRAGGFASSTRATAGSS